MRGNAVLLALALVIAAALLGLGFVTHAPNRLVSGAPLVLADAAPDFAYAAAALVLVLLAASLAPPGRGSGALAIAASSLLMLTLLWAAGRTAAALAASGPPAARTSLGAAFWIAETGCGFALLDALQRLRAGAGARLALAAALAAAAAAMLASGRLHQLSLLREYAANRDAFRSELVRHCELVLGAVVPALAIGAPLGLLAARRGRVRGPLLALLNAIETIPSIALFGLLLAPLAALAAAAPFLAKLGVGGIGAAPAIIALVLYSLLPVVRNTLAGIASVDAAAIEAAAGMGMTRRQRFWRVELPLGLPIFLAGLRIVVVQAIGLAAVAALIGAGGLGTFVFQGIGQYAVDLVLLGALPIIGLALAADFALALAIERLR